MIDHDEAWALLAEAATDTLADGVAAQLRAHVDGCALCTAELASLRAVATQLMYATPLEPVSAETHARIRARLEARAIADLAPLAVRQPGPGAGATRRPPWHRSRIGVFAIAASIALAASLAALGRSRHDRAVLRTRLASEDASALAGERAAIRRADSLERIVATVTAPAVTTVRLTASGTRPADATVYWNRKARVLTFIAHALPPARPGRGYELWILTDAAPLSGGMVTPDDRGDVAVSLDGAGVDTEVRGFALSDEPAGGSPQPTTQPLLSGKVPANG